VHVCVCVCVHVCVCVCVCVCVFANISVGNTPVCLVAVFGSREKDTFKVYM